MFKDFRLALRSLARTPGFTAIAILTLALGLGVNITIFGMIDQFLLRRLPVPHPEQLAFVMQKNPRLVNLPFPWSYPDYLDLRRRIEGGGEADGAARAVFSGIAAYVSQPVHVSDDGRSTERGWAHEVSDNYFSLLGVHAAVGRLFNPGEGVRPGADPIAILSHPYWIRRFHGEKQAIGQKLLINGVPFTIVGVTPRGFGGAEALTRADLFLPTTMADVLRPRHGSALAARGESSHLLLARLRPGVTAGQAQAAADTMLQRLIKAYPDEHGEARAEVIPEARSRPTPFVSQFTVPAVAALALLALLVLAVAVANVANLLYARAAEAERSLAIRSALGATRIRLMRFLLAESLVLAGAAALVAWGASSAFGLVLADLGRSAENPPLAEATGGGLAVVFTLAAAALTGLATGLLPAWRATRLEVVALLKDGAPSSGRLRHPFRTLLVGTQVAFTCIVLVVAGRALQSLRALSRAELGFSPDHVTLATFDLQMQRYTGDEAGTFQRRLLDRVRSLPGVTAAGLARSIPFDRHYGLRGDFGAEGYAPARNEAFLVNCIPVSPGFQEALRIPLLAGRGLSDGDDARAPAVALVSRTVAEHYWPGQDPVGRNLTLEGGRRRIRVIGVMPDLRYFMLADPGRPQIFLPLAQEPSLRTSIVVRSDAAPEALAASLASIAHALDPSLPIHNLTTFDRHIAASPLGLMVIRMGTLIAATQGALVLLLSVMGIYGLVAFAVARRTREIGIRMALGATATDVVTLVSRPSLLLTGAGAIVGLVLAALLAAPLQALLYGTASPLPVMAAVAVLLLAVTILACWLPARRAVRVDPVDALRSE